MQPEILTQLAKKLYELRHTGRIIPFVEVGMKGGEGPDWKPAPKWCHSNVDAWIARCPEYLAVRGWVVFNQSKNPFISPPRFHFAAHSVIARPDGLLLDITPTELSQPYPFIRHPGTTEEFDQIRAEHQIVFVDHYL